MPKPHGFTFNAAEFHDMAEQVLARAKRTGASGCECEVSEGYGLTVLESAVAAPQATMMGEPLISDPLELAAAYLFYICGNHPFVDGNKRTALAACLVFLEQNDLLRDAKLATDEWEKFMATVTDWDTEMYLDYLP